MLRVRETEREADKNRESVFEGAGLWERAGIGMYPRGGRTVVCVGGGL